MEGTALVIRRKLHSKNVLWKLEWLLISAARNEFKQEETPATEMSLEHPASVGSAPKEVSGQFDVSSRISPDSEASLSDTHAHTSKHSSWEPELPFHSQIHLDLKSSSPMCKSCVKVNWGCSCNNKTRDRLSSTRQRCPDSFKMVQYLVGSSSSQSIPQSQYC